MNSRVPVKFLISGLFVLACSCKPIPAQTVELTQTNWGEYFVKVQGTSKADNLVISGTGQPGEVLLDLNGDGSYEYFLGRVWQIQVFGYDGDDTITVHGSIDVSGHLAVGPGGGSDLTTVLGKFAGDLFITDQPGDSPGQDLVYVNAEIDGALVPVQVGGPDFVYVYDTIANHVNPRAEDGVATFTFDNCDFRSLFGNSRFEAEAIFKVQDSGFDTYLAFEGYGDSPFSAGSELYAHVSSCLIGGALPFRGASDTSELTVLDTEVLNQSPWAIPSTIQTYAGDDTVILDDGSSFEHDVEIFMQHGADQVVIGEGVRFHSDLVIETGPQSDSVLINGDSTGVRVDGNLSIETGAHGDSVDISKILVAGDSSLMTGNGSDQVFWNQSECVGDWVISLAAGNDWLNIEQSRLQGHVHADGGNHSDTGNQTNNLFFVSPLIEWFELGNMQ